MRLALLVFAGLTLPLAVRAEVPVVVTDFGPVQSLVMEVMGDIGTPVMLLPAGGDPHDFQLRPSQAAVLGRAGLIFWVGPQLMPALGDALSSLAPQARSVALLQAGGGRTRDFAEGGLDPHAWLDPANAKAWLGTIASELSARDPEHAAQYAANAAGAGARLAVVDDAIAAELAPVKAKPFVVYHDALGYFADHYGLTIAGAIELGDAASPSAADLTAVQGILSQTKAICVFPEVGRDPKFIASLTTGLDVRVGAAQDVEFLQLAPGPGQYEVMLQTIATTIADCLKP